MLDNVHITAILLCFIQITDQLDRSYHSNTFEKIQGAIINLIMHRTTAVLQLMPLFTMLLHRLIEILMTKSTSTEERHLVPVNDLEQLSRIYEEMTRLNEKEKRSLQRYIANWLHHWITRQVTATKHQPFTALQSRAVNNGTNALFSLAQSKTGSTLKYVHVMLDESGQSLFKTSHAVHKRSYQYYGHV